MRRTPTAAPRNTIHTKSRRAISSYQVKVRAITYREKTPRKTSAQSTTIIKRSRPSTTFAPARASTDYLGAAACTAARSLVMNSLPTCPST